MVNFIDLIKDIKGKRALDASNQADLDAYNRMLAGEDIDVQPTQQVVRQPVKQDTLLMGPDGKVDYNASVRLKQQTTPLSLADRLIGREVHIDKETVDPKTNEITTQRFSDYKPGFLNDFSAGYKENAATPISFNNFGQNKNLATRLGEGFGTAARLLDNPLMRGAIAYGLSNSMGDRRPLVQGLNAAVGTQQNRMKDRLYRDSLIEQMQNSIMNQEGFAELKPEEQQTLLRNAVNRVNSYRGFIGDDTYKQILTGMQLQDNAAYRNALLKTQMNNQILDNLLAQQKFAYQKQQDAIQNSFTNRKLGIEAIKANKNDGVSFSNITTMRKEFNQLPVIKNYSEINRQYNNVKSIYDDYKSGKLRANAADQAMVTTLNKILDPTSVVRESEFNRTAQGQALMDKMKGYLTKLQKGGSGLTDLERNDLFRSMNIMYDASLREAQNTANDYIELAERYNINPADIVPSYLRGQKIVAKTNTVKEGQIIVNKKTGERLVMRGGKWQKI